MAVFSPYINSTLTHHLWCLRAGLSVKILWHQKHYGRTSGYKNDYLSTGHSQSFPSRYSDGYPPALLACRQDDLASVITVFFRSGTNIGQVIIFQSWHLLWLAGLSVLIIHYFMAFSGFAPPLSGTFWWRIGLHSCYDIFLSSFPRTITPRWFEFLFHFAILQPFTF